MFKKRVFSDYGIEIFRGPLGYWIRYDAGHIAIEIGEDRISKVDAKKAMRSEQDAHEVIVKLGSVDEVPHP
jgi:hypothetical protein